MFGFLNINKAPGSTSRDAVNAVQKLIRPDKVGHAGTLDPLATGVLVVCIGPATRLTKYVQAMPKKYLGTFQLGVESETEDTEGELVPVEGARDVTSADLESVLPEFVGEIEQMPPKFSALKVNGKRAYDMARKGTEFELKARKILIDGLSLKRFDPPFFEIEIACSSGTYVRSLGRDIGRRLGSGAVMTALCRTSIGCFKVENSFSSDSIDLDMIKKHLMVPQTILGDIPRIDVPNSQLEKLIVGDVWVPPEPVDSQELAAIDESGRLLAILNRKNSRCFTPKMNFAHYWRDH